MLKSLFDSSLTDIATCVYQLISWFRGFEKTERAFLTVGIPHRGGPMVRAQVKVLGDDGRHGSQNFFKVFQRLWG